MSAHVFDSRDSSSPVRPSIWAFVVAVVVTGVVCWIVVDLAPPSFRVAVAWFVGAFALLLSVATAFAVFGLVEGRSLRLGVETAQDDADAEVHAAHEQVQAATGNLARQLDEVRAAAAADVYAARRENDAEAAAIADHIVPDLVRRLEAGASTETALAEIEQPRSDWGRSVVRALAVQMGRVERTKAAALAACASAASRMQAQTTSMAAELRDMEDSADSSTLARLLEVDHHNAQVGRLADSIAVLTGARSGRRWARPIAMESILRGAMSRISDYRRVQLHAPVEVAVVGYAAEGVIHLLAELVDNAAQFSPPSEQVHIYVEEAHAGVVVAIEDSGVGMMPRALARAEAAISAPAGDLSSVSGTRLGLAVVGQLSRKHGLQVSYRPSARGGIGVVVMIPRQLITEEPRLNPTLPARRGELVSAGITSSGMGSTGSAAGRHASALAMDEDYATDTAESVEDPPFELARRQPGQALAAQNEAHASALPPTPRTRTDPGAAFGAFQQARGRKDTPADDDPDTPAEQQ